MSKPDPEIPVHDSLTVVETETIYHTDDWWKAVVRYHYEDADEDEIAVYLWHEDDGWTRKNKYVVKTVEAWHTDRAIIEQFFAQTMSGSVGDEYPVSEYYSVSGGQTLFEANGWWKAILKIDQKGSYETEEVMVYLWQKRDGDWYRRQKYTIKDQESWSEEREAIESVLDIERSEGVEETMEIDIETDPGSGVSGELTKLNQELDAHLSDEYT